jgi:predicted nucleotidyltransferase
MFYKWPRCPKSVRSQVETVREGFLAMLGKNLIGVYLHGSLAMGCFNPTQSDIDLLVVVKRRLSARTRRDLTELFLAASINPCPIECSALLERDLRSWRHPAPYDFHYSEDWRARFAKRPSLADSRGRDPDLAAHVSVTRARGICLVGAPIAGVFAKVPLADYVDSAIADFRWARRRVNLRALAPGRRVAASLYFVLNAFRVWSLLATGQVKSKAEAARWARVRLPRELRELARSALDLYRTGRTRGFATSSRSLAPFIRFVEGRLREYKLQGQGRESRHSSSGPNFC